MLVALALGLLLVEVLVLGVVVGWIELPETNNLSSGSGQHWLHTPRTALAAVLATATPLPSPTPTLTPSQVAAQFIPQLDAALSSPDWDRALEIVAIMQGIDPLGEKVQQWSFTTHMQYGQALVEAGQESQAEAQFDRAVALAPDDADARLWQQTTQRYLAGREALAAAEWDAAIGSFTQAQKKMPEYSDVLARLVESYHRKGQAAIEMENWPQAIDALVQAYERAPKNADLAHLLSIAYRGQAQVSTVGEDWTAAVETLTEAHERLPKDRDVVDQLSMAYRRRGIARHEALKLKQAKADLEAALALRSGDAQARSHLDRVNYLLSKRIEIDISKQRLYTWRGDKLIHSWPCSTGLKGQDTKAGHFQVLDKIPMAYSRVWKLKMPNWLGIYWVKGIENGIHALPIRPNGSVMWGGLLGKRASYGCIILSKQAAQTLYKWADIGTQVHIHH
jgi:tetratricopeptide (TPR) repeat protein